MEDKPFNDLKEIKDIMNRSSRFISLSGVSGISAGILALVGGYIANRFVFTKQAVLDYGQINLPGESVAHLILIAIGTLILVIGSVIYFTSRKTKKRNEKIWDHQTKRLLINLLIPLVTGGVICLMLLLKGYVGIVVSLTLIFYGLALVNASKYTLSEIRSLGLIEIVLGLMAMQFISFALIFWAFGFGLLHIVYGLIIQRKYKS